MATNGRSKKRVGDKARMAREDFKKLVVDLKKTGQPLTKSEKADLLALASKTGDNNSVRVAENLAKQLAAAPTTPIAAVRRKARLAIAT